MECKNYNIKITEGNAFALLFPLKQRTFVSREPIDEDIDILALTDIVVKVGGVVYHAEQQQEGLVIRDDGTLARGTYNIEITATYYDNAIRAAYFEALTIVAWNEQSDAQQYIQGSPIVMPAAYCVYSLTDEELEALKEEYREKNAQLDQAIADAEEAKREWEEKAADLDGVAQEDTLTQGVQDIRDDISHIDIDTSTLAKQGTNPNATLSEVQEKIGTPASGQAATLFGAIGDVALSAQTLQSLADSWAAMVTHRENLDGWEMISGYVVNSVTDVVFGYVFNKVKAVEDNSIYTISESSSTDAFFYSKLYIESIQLNSFSSLFGRYSFSGCANLKELIFPALESINGHGGYLMANNASLKRVYMPSLHTLSVSVNNVMGSCPNLIDITIGAMSASFVISGWSPTNALDANSQTLLTDEDIAAGFTSNLQKLLYNIREHIAANLPVANNTVTFSSAVKAAIQAEASQATATAFTNKGWTIA